MPKAASPKNYAAMSVADVAELFFLTPRQVRNLIEDKGLPANKDGRGFTLDWAATLEWYVVYRGEQKRGNRGNLRPEGDPGGEEKPAETLDDAVLRKTKAEADLKELQLAREQGQVVAIADLERTLTGANRAIQTQVLALAALLAPQLIGMDDRQKIHTLIDRACRSLLSNLASIQAVCDARTYVPESDEE